MSQITEYYQHLRKASDVMSFKEGIPTRERKIWIANPFAGDKGFAFVDGGASQREPMELLNLAADSEFGGRGLSSRMLGWLG